MSNIPSCLMLPIKRSRSCGRLPNAPGISGMVKDYWEQTLPGRGTALPFIQALFHAVAASEGGKGLGETLKALFPCRRMQSRATVHTELSRRRQDPLEKATKLRNPELPQVLLLLNLLYPNLF